LNRNNVNQADLDREKEVLKEQIINEGKPAAMVDKIVNGKISKFYEEYCLVEQEFVKDPELTVGAYVTKVAKTNKGNAEIVNFVYFKTGDGIEKKEDNFAEEVAKMT